MKKKVALVGASGFVGSKLLIELSRRGHEVIAIARNIKAIEDLPNVKPVAIDVNQLEELCKVFKNCDAVISAFNAGWENPNIYEAYLSGAQHIQEATNRAGIKRFIFVGNSGSLYEQEEQLVDKEEFPLDFKQGAMAARDYLNDLKLDKNLNWTYFSPAIEMNESTSGTRRGNYQVSEKTPVYNASLRSVISVEDAAVAIVDELEHERFIHKQFTAGYA